MTALYKTTPTFDTRTKPGRIAWLLERRKGIGASDVVSLFGLQKEWQSDPYELWLDKTGQVPVDAETTSEAAEWGTILEPVVRAKAGERLGVEFVDHPGMVSLEWPWLRYNPDGYDPASGGWYEGKNTSAYLAADWSDDQVPDAAELQVQTGMAVTGADFAWVAGLIGGNRLVIRKVHRDQRLIDAIVEVTGTFWREYVEAGVEPPIGASAGALAAVRAQWPADPDAEVTVAEDPHVVRTWARQYADAAALEKSAGTAKAEARNNLVRLAEGAPVLAEAVGDTLVPLVKFQRGTFAKSRFEAAYPEIADTTRKKVDVLDTDALKSEHPTEYRQHQAVTVKPQDAALAPAPVPTSDTEQDLDNG